MVVRPRVLRTERTNLHEKYDYPYVDNPGHRTAKQHWRWWRPVLTGVATDNSKAEADLEQKAADRARSDQHDRRGPSWGRSISIERDGPSLERSRGKDGPEIGD